MAGVQLGIQVNDAALQRVMAHAPQALKGRLSSLIEGSAIDTQREMTRQAPVGVGGGSGLRGSIRYKIDRSEFRAEVSPVIDYAEAVESGSRPHWTSAKPGSPLARWARLKGISPYAVQRSIARKGTRPHPFVRPTFRLMEPRVRADVAAGIASFVQEVDSGRV